MEKVNNLDLSIIILSYKSKNHLAVLLPSIFSSETRFSYKVIVVDNGSHDGTVEWLRHQPNIKLIENENTGFSKGNNLGIKQASGRYILLLNPDTKLSADTLQTMLDFMEQHPEVGISGCKLVKANGKLDLACRRRFPNPWNSFKRLFFNNRTDYNYTDRDENESMEVDSVVGAFMLVRRSAMEKIGLLDESFFMYGEDLDWCWRCKEAGYKVWYYPATTVVHYKGESSKQNAKALRWFYDAMWIFYKKHYASRYVFLFNWLVWLGIYGRLGVLIIINSFKQNPVVSK